MDGGDGGQKGGLGEAAQSPPRRLRNLGHTLLVFATQSVAQGPAASLVPESLLEMQNPRAQPDPPNHNLHFTGTPGNVCHHSSTALGRRSWGNVMADVFGEEPTGVVRGAHGTCPGVSRRVRRDRSAPPPGVGNLVGDQPNIRKCVFGRWASPGPGILSGSTGVAGRWANTEGGFWERHFGSSPWRQQIAGVCPAAPRGPASFCLRAASS